jgi:hypothetical protein
MADVTTLNGLIGAYGIAVRAGAITPCIEDEIYFRNVFDLPPMPESAKAAWKKTDNIRTPITLAQPGQPVPPAFPSGAGDSKTGDTKDE